MRKSPQHMDSYDYHVPAGRIAVAPASPRDAARLMVVDRDSGRVAEDIFRNLARHLPPRSVIVLNRTKVVPARLWCRRATGGRVQVLYLRHDGRFWYALVNRPLRTGEQLGGEGYALTVVRNDDGIWKLRPSFPLSRTYAALDRHGTTPIPPYIKVTPLSERRLRREYQSVFARAAGSVAAPTASLHFTPRLIRSLKRAGHDIRFVTLHVGLGTFAPLTAEQVRAGKLHEERYDIDARTAHALSRSKEADRPVVAVGTTVARTLEAWDTTGKRTGSTDLFIRPGYRWQFVDALITNFHVPKSSLMMLVASLVGRERLLKLYRSALRRGYRFFSFGDGMLILP